MNEPKSRIKTNLQSLAAWVAAIVGVVALFIQLAPYIIQLAPYTPYYIGAYKIWLILVFSAIIALSSIILLMRHTNLQCLCKITKVFEPIPSSILLLIVVVSAAIGGVLFFWKAPTRAQVAQQILSNRDMRLTSSHYKTAIEVGNSDDIALFHDAGINPRLAFEKLGEKAEIAPGRYSVDVLMDLESVKFAESVRSFSASSKQQSDLDLIDTPIRLVAEEESGDAQLRRTDKLPLLGHAVSNDRYEAVYTLLELGANVGLTAIPLLLSKDGLSSNMELFLADQRLYLRTNGIKNEKIERLFNNERLSSEDSGNGECLREIEKDAQFVGYRRLDKYYEPFGFKVTSSTFSDRMMQASGEYSVSADNTTDAIIRVVEPCLTGLTESDRDAWVTVSEQNPVHYVGRYMPDSMLFTSTDGGQITFLASPNKSLEDIKNTLLDPKLTEFVIDCQEYDKKEVVIHDDQKLEIKCDRNIDVTFQINGEDSYFVAVNGDENSYFFAVNGDEKSPYMIIVDEEMKVQLPSGYHSVIPIALSDNSRGINITYQFSKPRVTTSSNEMHVTSWPFNRTTVERFSLSNYVCLKVDQFINANIDIVGDTGNSYLTLYKQCDPFSELIDFDFDENEINEVLSPGRYRIELESLDPENAENEPDLKLNISADTCGYLSDLDNGIATRKVRSDDAGRVAADGGYPRPYGALPGGDTCYSFDIAESMNIRVSIVPDSGDVDLELLDENGSQIAISILSGTAIDLIEENLERGTYYVKADTLEPTGYTISVEIVDN